MKRANIFFLEKDKFEAMKFTDGKTVRRYIEKRLRTKSCICQLAYRGSDKIFRCSQCHKRARTKKEWEETVYVKVIDHITKQIEIEYNEHERLVKLERENKQ